MLFFNSKTYYKLLNKEHPSVIRERIEKERKNIKQNDINNVKNVIVKRDTVIIKETNKNNSIVIEEERIEEKFDTVWIETDRIICAISEKGAKIISIKTKEYQYNEKERKNENIEFLEKKEAGGANLSINNISYDEKLFSYSGINKKIVIDNKTKFKFEYTNENNEKITKIFEFENKSNKIGLVIESDQLDGKKVTVGWNAGMAESDKEKGRMANYSQRILHVFDGKNILHETAKKEKKTEETGYYSWLGITSKYFLIALVAEKIKDADLKYESYEVISKNNYEKTKKKKQKNYNFKFSFSRFANGSQENYWIYAGPSKLTELKKYDRHLQKALFKGYAWFFFADKWFPGLCEFVIWLFINLQKIFVDYGIVIIIMTIILKLVTYPLTQSSMKSMSKMKDVQPAINKLRAKYKGNPQKMNKKLMEYYKKEGINPLGGAGGCLPMVVQMPIMISLFVVLRKAIELRGQGTFLIPWIKDLSKPEVLFPLPLGWDIPMYGSNFALLPVIMAILMYFQNKATIKDPNQKAMIYMMPVMMFVMFNNFPSGLVLYWTFSSVLQLIQQKIMDRKKAIKQ